MQSTFIALPVDIWKEILYFCDLDDISRLQQTCRSIQHAIQGDLEFWKNIFKREFDEFPRDDIPKIIIHMRVGEKYILMVQFKWSILRRIQLTAQYFHKLLNSYPKIRWAIGGGMCLRYHGIKVVPN